MLTTSSEIAFKLAPGLEALLTSAAFAPIQNIGWLRVTGSDRLRWLNGMVTNNIAALTPGQGCYNFFLNAQGRIQADCIAFLLEDAILLETAADRIPALIELLDRFIIMDDVELAPIDILAGILIAGPQALPIVQALGSAGQASAPCSPDSQPPATHAPHLKQTAYAGNPVSLIHARSPLVPRFEIWSDPQTNATILEELRQTPAAPATAADLEQLRILSGTPLYGTDIRNADAAKDLPQETGQAHALHFSKGCYLGQEIVERIRSRGAVHRTFTGFLLHGSPAQPGTILTANFKPAGELTSVTILGSQPSSQSPHLADTSPLQLALGYIRREALDTHASITYPGGTATPATLPFQLPESRA